MKAGLNGALTLGTLDGANVEIRDEVSPENIFIFGHTAAEIEALRASGYDPRPWVEKSAELRRAVDCIARGPLEKAHPGLFRPVVEELLGSDRYFLCADFDAYVECQRRATRTYQRTQDWTRHVHPQCGWDGPLLQRPHGAGVRGRHLVGDSCSGGAR